jgi:hypothetical protein
MAGKQELIELGEIPTRDTTNQDEAALARLGKKSVLKVCTSHLHTPPLNMSRSDGLVSIEEIWLSIYSRI